MKILNTNEFLEKLNIGRLNIRDAKPINTIHELLEKIGRYSSNFKYLTPEKKQLVKDKIVENESLFKNILDIDFLANGVNTVNLDGISVSAAIELTHDAIPKYLFSIQSGNKTYSSAVSNYDTQEKAEELAKIEAIVQYACDML